MTLPPEVCSEPEAALKDKYTHLINHQLPALARQAPMPVRFNHCFARIVLDNLFEDCWYNHLSRKQPAYKQLNETQLIEAIAIAQSILNHPERIEQAQPKQFELARQAPFVALAWLNISHLVKLRISKGEPFTRL